jgi:hypothetical protein
MSPREELAQIIDDRWHGYGYNPQGAADAILAAGYQRPRTITTVEELDEMPAWSVVRSDTATIWEKFNDFWAETLTIGRHPSDHISLPAKVLYEPEVSL